jgi:hypothetical protein
MVLPFHKPGPPPPVPSEGMDVVLSPSSKPVSGDRTDEAPKIVAPKHRASLITTNDDDSSMYDPPGATDEHWEALYMEDGWPFFHNRLTGQVSWIPPVGFICPLPSAPLPPGWTEHYTLDGTRFYTHTTTDNKGRVEIVATWGRPSAV